MPPRGCLSAHGAALVGGTVRHSRRPHRSVRLLLGAGAVAFLVLLWWLATLGAEPEARFISPVILPSPREVFASFPSLLNERALVQGIAATLKRVLIGFGLAVLVGVPLGIIAGSLARRRSGRRAGGAVRPQPAGRRPDSVDHPVVRHRRDAEGDVHLHRLHAVRLFGYRPRNCQYRGPLRRDRADPGRLVTADRHEGARRARTARHLRQSPAPVRHGVRVHHAGRVDQRRPTDSATC